MNTAPKELELPLPAPGMPMVSRLVSEGIDKKDPHVIWALAAQHPLAKDYKIVRMFIVTDPDSVEIYSVSNDAMSSMRDRIPWSRIMIVGEAMPSLEVFVDELAAAEGDGDDEPDDTDEPEAPAAGATTATNGQAVS